MDKQVIAEILAIHADRLNRGQPGLDAQDTSADEFASLEPLMQLAERIQAALTPVQPDPAFVRRLGKQLVFATSESRKIVTLRTRRAILVGAAALGSAVSIASALGIIAYLVHHRARNHSKSAM